MDVTDDAYTAINISKNITLPPGYNISWKIYANDTTGQLNVSGTYDITVLNRNATVTLNNPANGLSKDDTEAIKFNFTATDPDNYGFTNCSLYGNFTGTWQLNQTSIASINNGVIYTFATALSLIAGTYEWNVLCYNNSTYYKAHSRGNGSIGANYTLTINDTPPTVTVGYPVNGTHYNDYNGSIFVTSSEASSNCTLHNTSWNYTYTTSTIFNFINNTPVGEGRHKIDITCTDLAGNNGSLLLGFLLDWSLPYITWYYPHEDTSVNASPFKLKAYVFDTELDIFNFSIYDSSGANVYNKFNTSIATTYIDLNYSIDLDAIGGQDIYQFEICVMDALTDSPLKEDYHGVIKEFSIDFVDNETKNNITMTLGILDPGRYPVPLQNKNVNSEKE